MNGTLRICVPEDHAPDGTLARWTAIADVRPGQPYTYSTIGFSVYLDWEDSSPDPEWTADSAGYVRAPLVNRGTL